MFRNVIIIVSLITVWVFIDYKQNAWIIITYLLQNTHKDLFARNEINQANKVFMDARKCKELEQRLHDEQMRHQKLTNG